MTALVEFLQKAISGSPLDELVFCREKIAELRSVESLKARNVIGGYGCQKQPPCCHVMNMTAAPAPRSLGAPFNANR
jgi:hypothetical protein